MPTRGLAPANQHGKAFSLPGTDWPADVSDVSARVSLQLAGHVGQVNGRLQLHLAQVDIQQDFTTLLWNQSHGVLQLEWASITCREVCMCNSTIILELQKGYAS